MSLHPCAECRRAVSTRAHACPNCGAPPPGTALLPAAGAPAALSAEVPRRVAGPSEGFWQVARVVLRRFRIGAYGVGSAGFAAVLTGSFAFDVAGWALGAGVLCAVLLCFVGLMVEILETSLGNGGPDEE